VCVWMLWSCLSQCCNQVTLLWPASYLNFALTLFNGNGLKEMTKLEMELVPRQVEAVYTADILANCEMGQPKISVILKQFSLSLSLSVHSQYSSSSATSTSLQLIEYVMSMQETNLKARLRPPPTLSFHCLLLHSCAVQTKVVLKTKLLRKCLHIFNQ